MKTSKILLLILSFLTISISQIVASDAILSIDSGGHQSLIRKVIVAKNGDIITASDDKTIRIWDGRAGLEKRKILGQIGAGHGGIFTIALSSDEKYLAVGGFLANNPIDGSIIRIYNYQTGKLLNILKSHENVVPDLAFSQDNRYLASASADTTVKLWDMQDFSLINTIKFHSNVVYATKFITNGKDTYIASVGLDNKIALHTLKGKLIKNYTHNQKLDSLATNGNEIATCGFGNEILIFDNNLNLKTKIKSETEPAGLNYSPNGKYLIAGTKAYPLNINIYDSTQEYSKISSFGKHANLTQAVAFIDNNTAISAGGSNFEIYIWDIKTKKVKQKIVGTGQSVWSIGLNKDNIAFGNISMTQINQHAELQKSFNLSTKSLKALNDTYQTNFNRIDSYGLTHSVGGDYGYDAVLNIEQTGANITKDATNGLRHNCYGWWGEHIVSGGMNGHLKIYNQNGEEVANLIGHTGEVWSIALYGDRLVSGSSDQTIRVWDLAQLNNGETELHPTVTLFIGSDNEWVMWSDSGYYDASAKGDKYIGWHINQGSDKEALFYPVGRFKSRYYKPELIALLLEGYNESDALNKLNQKQPKLAIVDSLPPYLTFAQYPEVDTKDGEVSVKVKAISKSEITGYKYLFNGRPIEDSQRAIKPKQDNDSITIRVSLPKQSGTLSIVAQNEFGYSEPVEFAINYIGEKKEFLKPNLYILAVGVSSYNDKDLSLEFANKDALDFSNVMKKQKGKLYNEVVVKTLTDKDATKDNILDSLEWIQKQTTSKDIAMVFIAGHGVNDDNGNFYYLPSNYEDSKLKRTGVSFTDFKTTLSSISGKVILFADACHSGNIMGKRRAVDTNGLIAELNDAENGVVVFTSSTSKQYSLEDKAWNNGAFTKALVEGLDGKADFTNSGKITVDSLSFYVSERVKQLTNGRQTPAGSKPKTISDFPIGVK
jgi:WD40 repeat protein